MARPGLGGLTVCPDPGPNRAPSRLGSATLSSMTIKARVTAGRLVVDEPTDLPEGTELELLPLDPGDWLDDADRAALHEALRQSEEDVAADRLVDASEILKSPTNSSKRCDFWLSSQGPVRSTRRRIFLVFAGSI
jgi:hypothetical protein